MAERDETGLPLHTLGIRYMYFTAVTRVPWHNRALIDQLLAATVRNLVAHQPHIFKYSKRENTDIQQHDTYATVIYHSKVNRTAPPSLTETPTAILT